MFNKNYYYFNTIRKYVIAFGSMFKNIKVKRYDQNGNPQKEIILPLTYASGRTFIKRFMQNESNISVDISNYLPRITFSLNGIEIDLERQTQVLNRKYIKDKDNKIFILRNALPVNYNFEVGLWTKNIDDMLQVVEQILPFFQPNIIIPIIEFPEFDITKDVSVFLNSTNLEINIDHDEEEDEIIKGSLDFTLKGYLYPPISNAKLIKHININFHEKETYKDFIDLLKIDVVPEFANYDDNYNIEKNIESNY